MVMSSLITSTSFQFFLITDTFKKSLYNIFKTGNTVSYTETFTITYIDCLPFASTTIKNVIHISWYLMICTLEINYTKNIVILSKFSETLLYMRTRVCIQLCKFLNYEVYTQTRFLLPF